MSPQATFFRRKHKLINPLIQFRVVGIFAGMVLIALTVQALLFAWSLAATANEMPVGGEYLLSLITATLTRTFLVTMALILPLVVYLGVLSTFKFVGPVYRFEQHLRQVLSGARVGPCRIRKGDAFHGLCDLINEVTSTSQTERIAADSEQESEQATAA